MLLWEEELRKLGTQSKLHDKLEKASKDVAEKGEHKHLTFSMKGDQLVLFGEQEAVDDFKNMMNTEKEPLESFLTSVKGILKKPKTKKGVFKSTLKTRLPELQVEFQGKHWTEKLTRAYVQLGLLLHGFVQGGSKSYKIQHLPSWWPEGINFVTFVGPTHASRVDNDRILEAMYAFNGKNIRNCHSRSDSPMKKKKTKNVFHLRRFFLGHRVGNVSWHKMWFFCPTFDPPGAH